MSVLWPSVPSVKDNPAFHLPLSHSSIHPLCSDVLYRPTHSPTRLIIVWFILSIHPSISSCCHNVAQRWPSITNCCSCPVKKSRADSFWRRRQQAPAPWVRLLRPRIHGRRVDTGRWTLLSNYYIGQIYDTVSGWRFSCAHAELLMSADVPVMWLHRHRINDSIISEPSNYVIVSCFLFVIVLI